MKTYTWFRAFVLLALLYAAAGLFLQAGDDPQPAPRVERPQPAPSGPVYGPIPMEDVVAVEPAAAQEPTVAPADTPANCAASAPPAPVGMMAELKLIFTSEGIPRQLVWIAEVESGLDPLACSPSGAVGLFQLKSATAQRFGLQTGLFDERREPGLSARAAARYLRDLYGKFGSWPLVLAAYNAGEGRLEQALASAKARTLEAATPFLPRETKGYVPRVIALITDREGTDPADLPPPSRAFSDSRS